MKKFIIPILLIETLSFFTLIKNLNTSINFSIIFRAFEFIVFIIFSAYLIKKYKNSLKFLFGQSLIIGLIILLIDSLMILFYFNISVGTNILNPKFYTEYFFKYFIYVMVPPSFIGTLLIAWLANTLVYFFRKIKKT